MRIQDLLCHQPEDAFTPLSTGGADGNTKPVLRNQVQTVSAPIEEEGHTKYVPFFIRENLLSPSVDLDLAVKETKNDIEGMQDVYSLVHLAPIQGQDPHSTLTVPANEYEESFDFLGLPSDVRDRIYRILLVVKALVCPRQKRAPIAATVSDYTEVENRGLGPGLAYVLCHLTVGDHKSCFWHYPSTNANILFVCKQIHEEAKEILYGENDFEIENHTNDTIPKANFSIPLFSSHNQHVITRLSMKGNSMYSFRWMLLNGHNELIKAYPSVVSFALIFELGSSKKGYGKSYIRKSGEKWVAFVLRLRKVLTLDLFGGVSLVKSIPTWINLRAVFNGEIYGDATDLEQHYLDKIDRSNGELLKRTEIKRGLAEAFELFKPGYSN